jgi:signal transduction histidine kinase/CheY-like chemotaxis protein/HPt (histidine-containing phosphotransfer) domain-containing protein
MLGRFSRASTHPGTLPRVTSRDLLRWTAITATYFALVAIPSYLYGDNPALRGGNAVGVFLLLFAPRRQWRVLVPLLWLAAGAARALANAPQPWLVGACNAFEILAVVAVLHGRQGFSSPWYGREQLPRLLLAAGAVPILTSAAAAAVIQASGGMPFRAQWLSWYLASMLAYVTLTPLLLSLRNPEPRIDTPQPIPRQIAGIALIGVACVAVVRQELYPPLMLLSFPLVVLCTWYYRLPGASATMAVVAITGGFMAARDAGALFHILPPGSGLPARVQLLQLYLGAIVLCCLPFAVLRAEQDRLVDKLRRKSDARAEFLAAMSHEIRTPMTGVLGMADLLAAQELTDEQRRYVDGMRSSGRHLVNVINDILDFSRIETGKLELETIDFRVPEMIEQVRSLIQPMALEKGLAFEVRLAPGSPAAVRGDPTRLRQILLNLAGNAVKFTAQGSVTLQVSGALADEGRVRYSFQVRDTGIGIAPEKLDILFLAFTQADTSTAREYGGSGLGLAISQRLAEAMGGRIAVASTPGAGSVFTLDVALAAGDPDLLPAAGAEALHTMAPQRILVAEDVEINRDILRLALAARGHHLVFAHDGEQALARVQEEAFDIVLMDVQMPVMDGVEATRRIRALPGAVRDIPIIGLTANVMSQEQSLYLRAGMDECLMKPIEWDRLAATIARHSTARTQAPPAAWKEPPAAPALQPGEVPLLEERQIASLRGLGSEPDFLVLMRSIMDSTQRTVDEIVASAETGATAAAAHRLRGSAGTGGLARISALAASLEEACARGEDLLGFRERLAQTVRETRTALLQGGHMEDELPYVVPRVSAEKVAVSGMVRNA